MTPKNDPVFSKEERAAMKALAFFKAFDANQAPALGRLQRRIDHVDLRYSNGFAVRIQELRGEPRDNVRGRAARSAAKPEKKG